MIAVDTNIVLRLLLNDDERQVAIVRTLMTEQRLFVSLTVMLEVGWVLASRYQIPRGQLADMMETLLTLDRIDVTRIDRVRWAVERFRGGADWADAIHLVAAAKFDGFATFDKRLARGAAIEAPVAVQLLA